MCRGVSLAALTVLGMAGAALAAPMSVASGHYSGTTSQYTGSAKFSLTVSQAHVTRVSFQYSGSCQRSTSFLDGTEKANGSLPVKHGAFKAQWSAPVKLDGGTYTWSATAKISGHFTSAHRVKGTLSFAGPVLDASGNKVDECSVGRVTWKARR
jgi:uncharacterized protein with FMN-binding domain